MTVIGAFALAVGWAEAQTQTDKTPKFEVASIRPAKGCVPVPPGMLPPPSPGRLTVNCVRASNLILQAYDTYVNGHVNAPSAVPTQIEGGPDWINSESYAINAKAEDNASSEMMRGPMMQALLEDRFKLKFHRESREMPVYALSVAKGGFKLRPLEEGGRIVFDLMKPRTSFEAGAKPPCDDFRMEKKAGGNGSNLTITVQGMTLDTFSSWLSLMARLDRPGINNTGITGRFSFHLDFSPDSEITPGLLSGAAVQGAPPLASDPTGVTILTALQEQLGLKLEPAKGRGEFLIIDHVERPSEN
jgi:uncharacterized protein (TIGR03435 family)